jgi:glycosyltransferase involved in cell wall biosynthesis
VHWLGWRPDVPELLAASQALLLPSAWEGMPNVVLEAMAAGLPIVATDVEGVAELLGQNSGDQVAQRQQPQQFAEKIVALASDPNLASRLAAANRARAQQFSLEAMVSRYSDLFESLLRNTSCLKD